MNFSVNHHNFIQNAIKEGTRVDARGINDFRKIKITTGPSLGTAIVLVGQTRVISHVSCEIVRPSSSSANEGTVSINSEFSTMALPIHEAEKISEMEVTLSRMLEKTLRKSRAIDTEGLCIIAGEQVWAIRVDVRILNDNGNVFDCACLATMASLLHFKRPDVTVQGIDVTVHTEAEKALIPLSIHHIPISISFALFENADLHVLDPDLSEELAEHGHLTIVLNIHREICTVLMTGKTPVPTEKILLCSAIAGSKVGEINRILRAAGNN